MILAADFNGIIIDRMHAKNNIANHFQIFLLLLFFFSLLKMVGSFPGWLAGCQTPCNPNEKTDFFSNYIYLKTDVSSIKKKKESKVQIYAGNCKEEETDRRIRRKLKAINRRGENRGHRW